MRIIAGSARGRRIEAPAGRHTRPTLDRVRENLFNMIQGYVQGSKVLDLFAGSGSLSLEAISRGAESAVLVDSDRLAHNAERNNTDALGFGDRVTLFHTDWLNAIRKLRLQSCEFDLVFLDPPYAMTDLSKVFDELEPLIGEESLVVLEHESKAQISVPGKYEAIRERSWGFCSVTIYRKQKKGEG